MKMMMKKVEALEEERKKIQVFRRELPMCLELVNQAIEKCKKELYYGEKSDCEEEEEQILNNDGPILEQFLPLKRSNSSFEKQEEQQKITEEKKIDEKNLGMKVDWLKSVQLWNQNPDPPLKQDFVQNPTTKIELKKCGGGGAFQPFQSETKGNTNSISKTPLTTTITTTSIDMSNTAPSSVAATTSSTGDNNNSNGNASNKRKTSDEEKENDLRRKTRRCWSPELHKRFLEALQQLGGSHVATPKQIKELMKVDGLTNDEVKSHLQKYRIHTRGGPISAATHNSGNPQHQPPQFVVVGGIWVPPPPPEYVTTMAEATKEAGTKRMNTNDMYVALSETSQQVAAASRSQQQEQQHQSPTGSLHSEGRSKRGDHSSVDNVHSSSPTMSSTETTTTTSLSKHVK